MPPPCQVTNTPQRQWLGFGVLWQFIQDPEVAPAVAPGVVNIGSVNAAVAGVSPAIPVAAMNVSEKQIDLAIDLLLDLLKGDFADERELVLQRCLGNIQLGTSVAVSMRFSRKILGTFLATPRTWLGFMSSSSYRFGLGGLGALVGAGGGGGSSMTVTAMIDRLQKTCRLLDVIFNDFERFHAAMRDAVERMGTALGNGAPSLTPLSLSLSVPPISPVAASTVSISAPCNWNDLRIVQEHRISRLPLLRVVSERLEFLKYILFNSSSEFGSPAASTPSVPQSSSSPRLNRHQTISLWNLLGERALTAEIFDAVVNCFDVLVQKENPHVGRLLLSLLPVTRGEGEGRGVSVDSSLASEATSVFESGVLGPFFEVVLTNWVHKSSSLQLLNRHNLVSMLLRVFLVVNTDPQVLCTINSIVIAL